MPDPICPDCMGHVVKVMLIIPRKTTGVPADVSILFPRDGQDEPTSTSYYEAVHLNNGAHGQRDAFRVARDAHDRAANAQTNGYANSVTFHASLMLDNERKLHEAVRDILRRWDTPAMVAGALQQLVWNTLAGNNSLLGSTERAGWNDEIHAAGGIHRIDWHDLARAEMQA